ncbi:type IV pili methyl-accepting chemotaxis transducer N-terminal domain-containing protein [Nitrospina gracilis]|nr:type IV pili methyl-accepting chemotaxis transducer N-terminal domain-containing protein [Nitrospina gracilis]
MTYFLISSMVVIVLYTVSTLDKNHKHDANLIYLAGKQRMLTQQLSKNLMELQLGDNSKIAEINQVKIEFSKVLDGLEGGDADLDLDARETEKVLNTFNEIQKIWVPFIFNVELIIQTWPEINNSLDHVVNNNEKLYATVNSTLTMMRKTVDSETMLTAGTLRYLVEGITKNIFLYSRYRDEKYLLAGSEKIKRANRILKGLLNGDKELGLEKIKSTTSRKEILKIEKQFNKHSEKVKTIFEKLPMVLGAASYIAENNIPLLNAMNKAVKELANQSHLKVVNMINNEYRFLATLFILSTGLSFFIIRAITIPLKEVSEKVDQISLGMILQDQIEVGNRDEVGRIRNSFNRLIDSLTHLIKLLDKFTGGDYSNASQLRRGDIEKAIFRLIASKNL